MRSFNEVIHLDDGDALDLMRSRSREQEVLDILDEPTAGRRLASRPWPCR